MGRCAWKHGLITNVELGDDYELSWDGLRGDPPFQLQCSRGFGLVLLVELEVSHVESVVAL